MVVNRKQVKGNLGLDFHHLLTLATFPCKFSLACIPLRCIFANAKGEKPAGNWLQNSAKTRKQQRTIRKKHENNLNCLKIEEWKIQDQITLCV